MQATLAANSSIPAGLARRRLAADALQGAKGHAAGVVFVAPDGDILLLRRTGTPGVDNFVGHWALPGGGIEEGETPELGADREVGEEMGVKPEGKKKLLDQRITPNGLVFHTFVQPVADKFVPKLNDEYSGYAWAPLNMLPRPLHPAVEKTLGERLGTAQDMKPEEWDGLRDGFLKWTAEEEAEPEHALDADILALDRDSVRSIGRDGRLHVEITNISKATVSPYRGKEIPGYEALGLDPDKIYQLLRDPEELRKGAATFNNLPLLDKHVPVSAENYEEKIKPHIIGSTGTDAVFEEPFLKNSLVIWSGSAINRVQSEEEKEISCGYHYRPEMTTGNFSGMHYDGIMRDIVGNHATLVRDGRAGPDVVVGDSTENLDMTKPTRLALLTLGMTAASIAPVLAMDSRATLPKNLFSNITTKNFKDSRTALLAGVRSALDGKLRPGLALDATMEGLAKAIDTFADMPEAMDTPLDDKGVKKMEMDSEIAPLKEEVKKPAFDAEPLKAFLKEKGMGEDDIEKICGMAGGAPALDEDDDEAEAAAKKKLEDEKRQAEDALKTAKDSMKDMVTKPAMDAALKQTAEAITKTVRATERGIRAALAQVRPYVGELPEDMAFDSAADVKRHALTMLNVEGAKTMHADALDVVLNAQRKAGAHAVEHDAPLAMDAAATKSFADRFPDAGRIGNAA